MASASKTPNLNLPQWVGTEKPERTDLNTAFDAIDTTVASHLADNVSDDAHGWDSTTRFSIGSAVRDISVSGVQEISGVGFKPKAVLIISLVNATNKLSVGFGDNVTSHGFTDRSGRDAGSAGTYTPLTSAVARFYDSENDYAEVRVSALNVDGFSLEWTKIGNPTGNAAIIYLAFR